MTATEIAALLAKQADKVCHHLLPHGRSERGNWVIGGVSGERGKSLNIQLTGDKAGVWLDFASGEKGDMIGLWQAVRRCSLRDACEEATIFLGLEPDLDRPEPSKTWVGLQREMGTGTTDDLTSLATLRHLPSTAGLSLAVENHHLFFGPVFDKDQTHHCWIITDNSRLAAQARRMDGQPFADDQKSKTIHGTTGRWPIGIADIPQSFDIALTEGGPDFLAAYTLVAMLGLESGIQPVAMLGSGQSIHPAAIPHFRNRTIWCFPHNDENLAGLQGAIRWERQVGKLIPFDFSRYHVKDLNEFVSALTPTR